MNYTYLLVFICGLAGVLLHNLVKIDEINKDPSKGNFSFKTYLNKEWASILISIIVVGIATMLKKEIKQLELAGNWLGFAFIFLGYTSQSLLVKLIGRAKKIVDDKL